MNRINFQGRKRLSIILTTWTFCAAGCNVDFDGLLDESGSQTGTLEGRIRADTVTIRFRNHTVQEAVNVEFHATNNALSVLPDDLFMPENLIETSVGVAGTGIIQPRSVDVVELRCTDALTLGTLGGDFLDNESGEHRGRGNPRWLEEGPLALCGALVTFEFLGDGSSFMTVVSIQR